MLKTSILSVALMTSAMLSNEVHAGLFDLFSSKSKVQSQAVKDVYAGLKFNYLDTEDRLLIVNDFLKTVELEYALLPLKAKTIGLDFKKLKEEAIAAENAVADVTLLGADRKNEELKERVNFLQASSNMDFLDRMQALVAKFQDTHFGIDEKIPRPFIYNGIRLFRVEGKIVVGSLENKFLSMAGKLSATDFSGIKIGDEVISIDGVPVDSKVAELKPYIGGSTDEFIDSQAVRSLTLRNFKYEKKNYMKIQFKNAGLFKVPLFANNSMNSTPRLDAITYFNKYGIQSDTSTIGITYDKTTNKWNDSELTFTGYSARKIFQNLKGVTEYISDDGTPGMRTGYYISKGKTYGVLQLLTFSTRNFKTGETTVTFLDAIRNFVLEMKDNELPLIFDLRSNGGGNASFPAAVLSILAPKDTVYSGPSRGLRMTHYIRQVYEPQLFSQVIGEDQTSGVTVDDLRQMIDDSLDLRTDYMPMFSTGPIETDSKVKGFNNDIVALVTADCISACDMMSFLLKSSGRAIILGTHSNGTGAGYTSTSELNTKWEDRLKMLSTQIPNFLFGFPGENSETKIFEQDSVLTMCSENKPTFADVKYSTTLVDIAKNNLGWLQTSAYIFKAVDDFRVAERAKLEKEKAGVVTPPAPIAPVPQSEKVINKI